MTFTFADPLSHLRGAAASPTADLYFAWSCAKMIEEGRVRKLSETVFQAGRSLIVFRHAANMPGLPDHDRLILVVDDNWRAGMTRGSVPFDYGLKLAWVEARAAKRLEQHAHHIVVSSPALRKLYAGRYPRKRIDLLAPHWPADRVAPILQDDAPPVIALLCGRSHALDAPLAFPAIQAVLSARAEASLVVSAELPLPPGLARGPRVQRVPSMSWGDYRRWMNGRSFTIGLYPLRETEFNLARSLNKLLEYDQFGAAVLGSTHWESAHEAERAGRCILLENDGRHWADHLLQLIDEPQRVSALANRNRSAILATDNAAMQFAFWSHLLN